MEQVRIDTTQNVSIDYTLATVWERVIAWFADWLILLCWVIILLELQDIFNVYSSDTGEIIFYLVMILPIAFYHLLCELFFNGQSFGKQIMKIKVVMLDGTQPALGNYLLRWLMRLVEFTMFMGLALVAFLMSGKGQRIGDMLAGTTVIRKKKKYTLQDTILYNFNKEYTPVFPQVKNLSNRDIEIVKEGLKYSLKNKNYNTIFMLNDQVSKVMGVENHGMPYADFLRVVVQDYNYYQSLDAVSE